MLKTIYIRKWIFYQSGFFAPQMPQFLPLWYFYLCTNLFTGVFLSRLFLCCWRCRWTSKEELKSLMPDHIESWLVKAIASIDVWWIKSNLLGFLSYKSFLPLLLHILHVFHGFVSLLVRWIFLSQFWPFFEQNFIFKATGAVVNIG